MTRAQQALELAKALDTIRLLQQCEKATGTAWITDNDRLRVRVAAARFDGTPEPHLGTLPLEQR